MISEDITGNPVKKVSIHDAVSGAALATDVFGENCGEPAWSPDGTKILAICGVDPNGVVTESKIGDLRGADVAADGMTVSNIHTVVAQAAGQGRPAYPSFSPDSQWIAFGRPTAGSYTLRRW